jgi:hypothetical protein
LNAYERAKTVAHYRLHLLVEAHVNDAARPKPGRRGRGR